MRQHLLIFTACCLLTSASCSVVSSQRQEQPQEQQTAQQNSQPAPTVLQPEATPPEDDDKQILEAPKGVKKQIEFKRGRTSATVTGRVIRMSSDEYTVAARAGQRMTVTITSVENNAAFFISSPNGENLSGTTDAKKWTGMLPTTGEYLIEVGASRGNASYKLGVSIK